MSRVLLLCDCQNDHVVGPVAHSIAPWCMDRLASSIFHLDRDYYSDIFVGLDWHPAHHISFSNSKPHCVQHSLGAAVYSGVYDAIMDYNKPIHYFLRGQSSRMNELSLMSNIDSRLSMLRKIRTLEIKQIDIVGPEEPVIELVQDFCNFSKDGLINVLLQYCPSCNGNVSLIKMLNEENVKYQQY